MRKTLLRLLATALLGGAPLASLAGVVVGVSINIAPPALPVYVQPPCPGIGYIWTPGYWAWGTDDYYWVPGTWVLAPAPGLLWTPGYWGWVGGAYVWHVGYWGPHVGFYGGVNYGFGYSGVGFEGGYWRGGAFFYNRAVANLGTLRVTNVYNRTVINNVTINRVSYNGGSGGIVARPTAMEMSAARERHVEATSLQGQQERLAMARRDARASVNRGRPSIAATVRPGAFTARSVVAAHEAGGAGRGPAQEHFDRPPPQHFDRPPPQHFDRPPQASHPGYPAPPAGHGPGGSAPGFAPPHGGPAGGAGHGPPPHPQERGGEHGGGRGQREEHR